MLYSSLISSCTSAPWDEWLSPSFPCTAGMESADRPPYTCSRAGSSSGFAAFYLQRSWASRKTETPRKP